MSVEQDARELLAAKVRQYGDRQAERDVLGNVPYTLVLASAAISCITAALLRSSASRDEVLEECAKAVREAIYPLNPEDDWTPYAHDKARACRMAEKAIRDLKQPAQGGEG